MYTVYGCLENLFQRLQFYNKIVMTVVLILPLIILTDYCHITKQSTRKLRVGIAAYLY